MNVAIQNIKSVDGNIILRKNDFDQFPHTVLLLNGIHQTRSMWEIMEGRLRRYNYGVCSLNLSNVYSDHRFATLENQSYWLQEKLDRLFTKYDSGTDSHCRGIDWGAGRSAHDSALGQRSSSSVSLYFGYPTSQLSDGTVTYLPSWYRIAKSETAQLSNSRFSQKRLLKSVSKRCPHHEHLWFSRLARTMVDFRTQI